LARPSRQRRRQERGRRNSLQQYSSVHGRILPDKLK
jgi:hypothetical protein